MAGADCASQVLQLHQSEGNTKEQIQKARSHPWISEEVPVRGFVYDVETGRLSEVYPDQESVTVSFPT
jgi:carbonic anhydrase